MQAAQAWEQGTSMFDHGSEHGGSTVPRDRAPTEMDVKRMIAGNLETVQWMDSMSMINKEAKRYFPARLAA